MCVCVGVGVGVGVCVYTKDTYRTCLRQALLDSSVNFIVSQ